MSFSKILLIKASASSNDRLLKVLEILAKNLAQRDNLELLELGHHLKHKEIVKAELIQISISIKNLNESNVTKSSQYPNTSRDKVN